MAITLTCTNDGLKIFATPLEWLYEYPTIDDGVNYEFSEQYVKPLKQKDIVTFLKTTVGSYDKVTLEDLVREPESKWIYVRFAYNLDSSKQYLNDLPESNLKVAQIYTEQTGMPFHMKKFYGSKTMTYLYFQNFYHPLNDSVYEDVNNTLTITIYLRNLNIFREYIPQNIITKYYNLHLIKKPLDFPQLMFSLPFANIKRKTTVKPYIFTMEGYNYYQRSDDGIVLDTSEYEINEYDLKIDTNVKTLRPPRNFWRLNLLNINEQPKTCDFEEFIDLNCNSPNFYCFEDNKPFACSEGTNINKPYYLDINNLKCQQYCNVGYMHPPRYSLNERRLFCSHFCDTGNKQCPSDNYKYADIHTNFLCSNNFFNLYYKCYHKDESINNADFGGIFFSSVLRTPTIFIDLGKEYKEFAVDFWYYPDNRLRNKRYPDPNLDPPFDAKSHKEPESEKNRIIFWSDCCRVVYGEDGENLIKFYNNGVLSSPRYSIIISPIDAYNWNHFVLTYFYSVYRGFYTYYLTLRNEQYVYCDYENDNYQIRYDYWEGYSNVVLSQIIFCTYDDSDLSYAKSIFGNCKNAQWLDGFYRKLQVFDLTYSSKQSVFYAPQFEDDGLNGILKHRYIFGLNSIVDNRLLDLIGGKNGRVPWVYNTIANQNPDRTNYIIYETNYSPQSSISDFGSSQTIANYLYEGYAPELFISSRKTHNSQNCLIFQNNGNCLACKKGYSIFSKQCKGEENNNNKISTYYYKNPGKNMPERLSLNLNFEKTNSSPSFTIFFFIKLHGFVKGNPSKEDGFVKLIIFHEEKNEKGEILEEFYLAWTSSRVAGEREKLYFFYNGKKLFSYGYYREHNFGLWVPISFTAFRENDRLFQMNMAQASILYSNLGIDGEYTGDYYPYVKITQFTILNTWVGLMSDVKLYDRFIVNAWGIVRHKLVGDSVDDVPDSAISEIDLKSNDEGTCLSSSQILNQPASGYIIECVPDYNPHFSLSCGSMESQTVRYHQGDGYRGICGASCYTGKQPGRCLGGNYNNGLHDVQSCENKSPVWKNYVLIMGSSNKINCDTVTYIDFNRFKYAKVTNIASPQDVWAIDFWFYTGTCHATYKRTGTFNWGNSKSENINNFKEFTIEWNYHIKLRIHAEKKDDVPSHNDYVYYADCTPIVVLEHPDLNSPDVYISNIGDRHYQWSFITCGVNFQEKIFYQTDNNKFSSEKPFNSKLLVIPGDKTSFVITENSPLGYGFTFIHQLRLWHCYNCAHSFRNLDFDKNDKNFNAVYHNFDGINTSSAGPTLLFSDTVVTSIGYDMEQPADYPGYTINYSVGSPVLCDESIYNYYDETTNSCQKHYNMARIPNDFDFSIPSSRNGRYSMDFWFFIENSSELTPGINILWKNHMSITLLRDTSNKYTINAICFPQSYRDDVDTLGGQGIIDLYDKAINKDKFSFYQGSSMWNFIRCSVDQTRKIFYINDNVQLDLDAELLYGTTRNYRPFRYFKINRNNLLKFQNHHDNPTRIFVRQVKCYRDFIDYRLMDMKYIVCGRDGNPFGYWDIIQFYPLVFCFDFNDIVNPYWTCSGGRSCFECNTGNDCGLAYQIYYEDSDQIISPVLYRYKELLKEDDDVFYTTFPDIYQPYFCDPGQSGGNNIPCRGGTYPACMRNSTALFWPKSDYYYLNLDTLT